MIHRSRAFLGFAAALLPVSSLVSCRAPDDPHARQASTILGSVRPPADAKAGDPPPVMREFRAAWVATVGNIDWPTKPGLSTARQQAEAIAILDKSAELRLNAIVLQVRPTADALYASKIEPWSGFLTGTQGKAPDPYYDPLTFWVAEAHKRGIELHAWFNPYRTRHAGSKAPSADTHVSKVRPDLVRANGGESWMDPGEPDAADWSFKVFMDVVERYDVDGIHIDDYFYPYPAKNPAGPGELPFPDDASYAKYTKAGGTLARDDWRRDNVSRLIERVYKGTKERKPWVQFGISPFGVPRPGASGIEYSAGGFDQYKTLYADTARWLANGWCDYFAPQLYWPTGSPKQPYLGLLQWWTAHNPKGRFIYGGLYTGRINGTEKSWAPEDIAGQVMQTRLTAGAHGEVHFSMKTLMRDTKQVSDVLRDGVYAEPALVPAATWLDATPPPAPTGVTVTPAAAGGNRGTASRPATGPATDEVPAAATAPTTIPSAAAAIAPPGRSRGVRVAWRPGSDEAVRVWVVQYKVGSVWHTKLVPGDQTEVVLDVGHGAGSGAVKAMAVSAVDRSGNQSKPATADPAGPAGLAKG